MGKSIWGDEISRRVLLVEENFEVEKTTCQNAIVLGKEIKGIVC